VTLLNKKLQGLVGDTLVAAAAVSYIGPFTSKYRKDFIHSWLQFCKDSNVPISRDFDLVKSTVDAHQVGQFFLLFQV